MNSIFNMFGRSPIRPLEQHMHKVHRCAKNLEPFLNAVIKKDWQNAEKLHETICELEKEADEMKKDLRLHLPSGLFLPVPRTDILEVLHHQDMIANKTKDIAGLIMGRKMIIPSDVDQKLMPLVQASLSASKQACKAINELDELLESGFRGSEVQIVEEMIVVLDQLEHTSDEKLVQVRQAIFNLEDTLSPIEVIFLYKVVEWIGQLADCAQNVGGRLQMLLAR